jgi:hypothetical protein
VRLGVSNGGATGTNKECSPCDGKRAHTHMPFVKKSNDSMQTAKFVFLLQPPHAVSFFFFASFFSSLNSRVAFRFPDRGPRGSTRQFLVGFLSRLGRVGPFPFFRCSHRFSLPPFCLFNYRAASSSLLWLAGTKEGKGFPPFPPPTHPLPPSLFCRSRPMLLSGLAYTFHCLQT